MWSVPASRGWSLSLHLESGGVEPGKEGRGVAWDGMLGGFLSRIHRFEVTFEGNEDQLKTLKEGIRDKVEWTLTKEALAFLEAGLGEFE